MKFPVSDILERQHERPPGYVDRIMAAGIVAGDQIEIPDEAYRKLCEEFRGKGADGCCGGNALTNNTN